MAAVINDLDHAFASAGHDLLVGARAVVSWEQRKVNPNAAQIEAVSALIPVYGTEIELFERLVFASFGVLATDQVSSSCGTSNLAHARAHES